MNQPNRTKLSVICTPLMIAIAMILLASSVLGNVETAQAAGYFSDVMMPGDLTAHESSLQESEPIAPVDPPVEEIVDMEGSVSLPPAEYLNLYVGPELVDCYTFVLQKCMQVRENPNDSWQNFYSSIQGFTYESGYHYELLVRKEYIDTTTLADAPSVRYILEEIVFKQRASKVITWYVAPELVDCQTVVAWTCMQVRQELTATWQNFYGSIEGFTHESGYEYELLVRVVYAAEIENSQPAVIIADKGKISYVLEEVVSKVAVNEPTTGPATLHLMKTAIPNSSQNFRFVGDLGSFKLDNPAVDDNDGIFNEQVFSLEPGTYTVTELVNKRWQLVELSCSIDAGSANSYAVDSQQLTLTIVDSGNLSCEFISKRAGLIRVQNFNDKNGNGKKDRREGGIMDMSYGVYTTDGELLASKTSNMKGRLNFKVAVGTYKVCEDLVDGRQNTLPGTIDGQMMQACRTVTVEAGKRVNVFFGSTISTVTSAALNANADQGIFIEDIAVIADEDGGYDEDTGALADEETELFSHELFIPLVQR